MVRTNSLTSLLVGVLLIGCAHIQAWLEPSSETQHGRVSRDSIAKIAYPVAYSLELQLDPRMPGFDGRVSIKLRTSAPTNEIQLHAIDLSIERAQIELGARRLSAQISYASSETIRLEFPVEIPVGTHVLTVDYRGAMAHESRGLFRVKDQDEWYSFTQFSPRHARRVFPCFDQPGLKAPIKLTLTVPQTMTAVANAPVLSQTTLEQTTIYRFEETSPIPIYLVAFAVGPLEYWPSIDAPMSDLKLRVLTTKGKSPLAQFAVDVTPTIYDRMRSFVQHPYPYPKLDLIAVPSFDHGGMENAGLVTMRENLLLHGDATTTATRQLWTKLAIAHELAHSYFGNAVSPTDWNERWLSEALSTWLAQRVVTDAVPDANLEDARAAGLARLLRLDRNQGLPQLAHGDGKHNGIKQAKGAALIHMVSAWIGRSNLRSGVRQFLKAHAHRTARHTDLVNALDKAVAKRVGPVLNTFVKNPGYPILAFDVACGQDRSPTLNITQRPVGTAARDRSGGLTPWHIPVCFKYGVAHKTHKKCVVLSEQSLSMTLKTNQCPDWLHGNADQSGYYSWYRTDDSFTSLIENHADALTSAEMAALPETLFLHLESGVVQVSQFVAAYIALANSDNRYVIEGIVNGLRGLSILTDTPTGKARLAGFVRQMLGPHLTRLGFEPAKDETTHAAIMRPLIMFPLAFIGADPIVERWARNQVRRYLDGHTSLSNEQLLLVLPIAARTGDDTLWNDFVKRLEGTNDPMTRVALLRALGSFEDPRLFTQSLDLVRRGALDPSELISIGQGVTPATRDHAWMWMSRHFEKLSAKLGSQHRAILPWLSRDFCTPTDQQRVTKFFHDHQKQDAVSRELARITHRIEQCIDFKAKVGPSFQRWLHSHSQAKP